MRRREFISLIGSTAVAWPLAARAQQSSDKIPVVGVLWHAGSAEEEDVYLSVLVKAFNNLGYVEGKNILLDHRFPAEKPERFFLRLVSPSCTVRASIARAVATSFFLLHALDDVLALAQEAIASAHVFCHCCATCM